ncbi:MAG: hypothetical protein NVSMB39_2300 [Candidatus Saccharimonadales bacterium]
MKTKLPVLAVTLTTRLTMGLLTAVNFMLASVTPAQAVFNPGAFFGCADTSVLDPVAPFSKQITGWGIGIGIIVLSVVLIIAAFKIGSARDDMGKAAAGAAAIKNVLIGAAILLIALNFFFLFIVNANKFCIG